MKNHLAKHLEQYVIGTCVVLVVLFWALWWIDHSDLKAELLGDSFGLLTSLFSGLAFLGLILQISLQRKELKAQIEELKNGVEAQNKLVELTERRFMTDYSVRVLTAYAEWLSLAKAMGRLRGEKRGDADVMRRLEAAEETVVMLDPESDIKGLSKRWTDATGSDLHVLSVVSVSACDRARERLQVPLIRKVI